MQPNLQTDIQIMTIEQGNTALNPNGGSLKGKNELKGEAEGFLGILDKIERVPDKNKMDLRNLQEKSQRDENILGMIVKTDQEIYSLINDMTLKGGNIPELLPAPEQNKEGNEEKQLSSKTAGQELLKGQISGNEKAFSLFGYFGNTETENSVTDKNSMVIISKTKSDFTAKRSGPGEMLNISVKTEENESKTGQGELNKNNPGVQISKGLEGAVGKEAGIQTSKGLEGAVGKNAGIEILKGLEAAIDKEAGGQISKGPKGDVGKETGAQLLKGLEADIAKTIKNSETKGNRADGQIEHAPDIKNAEKTAATDRILMEGTTARTGVEESKIVNSPQIFNDELKDSEFNKKDLLLKVSSDIKEKEQGSDSLQKDNTSDKKASQQDKEFINLKEAGLKIKASGNEFSAGKITPTESESKDSGIILPKTVSGEKSPDEIMPGRENRLTSNISRAGTLNQIVEKAVLNLKNGKSQVRIDLKPEFLGSVRMKIATENHLITVRILTELPVVKEMIENNISQLKSDLQSHGLEINKLDVSVANDSQRRGKGFEKADFLSEKENRDIQDNKAVSAEETGTVNLLKEGKAENGLDYFA